MNNTLISVIIPVYNGEKTIIESLKAIVNEEVNIIIVDDGSKDNTYNVCTEFAKDYDNVTVLHQENQGPGIARLYGISKAKSKYIMFLDSDDEYYENTISRMKQVINKYHEPDLIRFRYKRVPDDITQTEYFSEAEKYIERKEFKEYVYPMYLTGYMLNAVWSNCVKKEILDKIIVLDEEKKIRFGEDLLYSLNIFSTIENAVFLQDVLYKYVYRSDSATRSNNKEKLISNLKDEIYIYTKLYEYLIKWDMLNIKNVKLVRERILNESNNIITRLL